MGIQINGNTDNISATDGGLTVSDLELNQTGVSTFHSHLHVADQIIHLDDANSKIRFPAADTITAETAGTERLRITSSGEVKIMNTSGTVGLYFQSSSGAVSNFRAIGTNNQSLGYFFGNTEKVRFDSSGRVGIGTDDPSEILTVHTASGNTKQVLSSHAGFSELDFTTASTLRADIFANSSEFTFTTRTAIPMVFRTNGTNERLRITSDGQVRIADANQGLRIGVDAANYKISRDPSGGDAGLLKFYGNQSGYTGYIFSGVNGERLRISSTGNASLGLSADAVPTASSYNSGTLHLHQPSSGSYGSQIKMTTASGGSNAGDGFYIAHWGGNNETFIYNKENTPIRFGTNSTERFVIKNDGDVSITDGNLIVASGHGISFAASGNFGTMNSEILDDYEEGYWTPTIGGHAGDGSTSYSNQKGSYVRVGGIVHLNWYISWNSTSASGQFRIYGQPYTAATTYGTNYNITTGSMMFDSIATPYQYGQMVPYIAHGVNQIVFYSSYYTGGWSILNHGTETQDGGSLICSISYRAA